MGFIGDLRQENHRKTLGKWWFYWDLMVFKPLVNGDITTALWKSIVETIEKSNFDWTIFNRYVRLPEGRMVAAD